MIHLELAIEKDEGTITIDSFYNIEEAVIALKENDNPTAFIYLWEGCKELGQTLNKKQLKKLNK